MRQAASQGFLNATDLADYLVTKGMPFRKAHACAGEAVQCALAQGKELHELPLVMLQTVSADIDADVYDFLALDRAVERRLSYGGTARVNVTAAIAAARQALAAERSNRSSAG
jgi:argininosuccinate lyase